MHRPVLRIALAAATVTSAAVAPVTWSAAAEPPTSILVPDTHGSVEGTQQNAFPFHIGGVSFASQRYQQVYVSDQFASTGAVVLTGIRFRPDVRHGEPFDTVLPDVEIRLSTTSYGTDAPLSRAFADNVGADEQVVVARGALALSSSDVGAGPRDFDVSIPFDRPFSYDPADGNLLLDVWNRGGGETTFFDAEDQDESTARAFTLQGGVDSEMGFVDRDRYGLVTMFELAPPVLHIRIDVLPGSETNPIRLPEREARNDRGHAGGLLPVALLAGGHFDPTAVDPATVSAGFRGQDVGANVVRSHVEDIDGDGSVDLVLHVPRRTLGTIDAAVETPEIVVTGAGFVGTDTVTIVGRPATAPRRR